MWEKTSDQVRLSVALLPLLFKNCPAYAVGSRTDFRGGDESVDKTNSGNEQ